MKRIEALHTLKEYGEDDKNNKAIKRFLILSNEKRTKIFFRRRSVSLDFSSNFIQYIRETMYVQVYMYFWSYLHGKIPYSRRDTECIFFPH